MADRNPPLSMDELLCFDLYAASRALTAVYRPLLAELGLTYPQYLVLVVLWGEDGRTVGQLGDALRLDYGTLSPLLRRLQQRGLLSRERDPLDERSVVVSLTPAGRALRRRSPAIQRAVQAAVDLPDQAVRQLQDTLRALTESAARTGQGTAG